MAVGPAVTTLSDMVAWGSLRCQNSIKVLSALMVDIESYHWSFLLPDNIALPVPILSLNQNILYSTIGDICPGDICPYQKYLVVTDPILIKL